MEESLTRVVLDKKEIIIIGTAHVSKKSMREVEEAIRNEKPDVVCVEIDQSRYKSLTEGASWENLDVIKILKEKKGFLLLANLVLSSFQKRLGLDLGVKPGEEMLAAVSTAKELDIPFALCDREIQITLRRAWAKSNFWSKNKMLAALFGSVFSREKLEEKEIEKLKEKNMLQNMLEELSGYLPSVKEVLIDERDQFLATKIYSTEGNKLIAVVGAGHVPGIVKNLKRLDSGEIGEHDLEELKVVPAKGFVGKILPWVIPALILALIAFGFFRHGWQVSLEMLWKWVLVNGSLSALGSLIALAHPITILTAFLASPITSMNPTLGVGIFTGIVEAFVRKPRVIDFENLNEDITSFKGFFRNRFTHVFVVFFMSSLGSSIGTFIAIPFLAKLIQ